MSDSDISILNPDRKILAITILSTFLLISFFSTLFLIPLIGTIIGLVLDFLVLILAIYIITSKLMITQNKIIKSTILGKQEIEINKIVSINKVRVVGTVSRTPFLIRQISFKLKDGSSTSINVLLFPYNSILDLIEMITNQLE